MMRGLKVKSSADPAEAVLRWLASRADSPCALRKGAVVLIDPPDRRGEVLWRPEGVALANNDQSGVSATGTANQ